MSSIGGVALVASNLAFILSFIQAFLYRRWTRGILYLLMMTVSGLYHLCGSYDVCVFSYQVHHGLDFFFAELLIPVSAIYLVYFSPRWAWVERYLIFLLFAPAIFVLQIAFSGELLVQAAVAGVALAILIVYWIYFALKAKWAWQSNGKRPYPFLGHANGKREKTWKLYGFPPYRWNNLVLAVAFTAVSISFFSVQNMWHQGYWAIHSIWHINAAIGQVYLLASRPPAKIIGRVLD
jgi:Protein of unknown function (DUF3522)